MNYYHYQGEGLSFGSTIIVCASNRKTADILASRELDNNLINPKTLELNKIVKVKRVSHVILFDNGDY